MAISVAICGLVRDPDRLMFKVGHYEAWHQQGIVDRIVYATWIDEIDRYKGLRKRLQNAGVTIVEIEEPRLVLKGGHQLHQMAAFHYALSMIEDPNQFVLKTRVDLADNTEEMLHDFAVGTPAAEDFGGFGLQNKILIENAQMIYPFLCGDAQFFGRKSDLEKLVNMSAEMEMIFNRLAVEQTFFFTPFERSRMFRQHFYWNLPHISEIAHKRNDQLGYLLRHPFLNETVKAWWLILEAYFKLGWGPAREAPTPGIASIEDAFSYDGPDKFIGADKSDVLTTGAFSKALVALLSEAEALAIKAKCGDTSPESPLRIEPKRFDEYEGFRKLFSDLPAPKATREGAEKLIIRGAAQHFFVKKDLDDASTRYHEQITALRRENDYLKRQLNITLTPSVAHRVLNRVLPRRVIEFMKYKMPALTAIYAKYWMKKQG